jgi:phosphonate transport system substrate-binding protein
MNAQALRQFTVSPDFTPERMPGWFIFNTWLQRQLGERIHLELYDSFVAQRAAIRAGKVDLIYANPYDAALLVREHGFVGGARPLAASDEVVVAVPGDSPAARIEDLRPGIRLATTDDPDIRMLGMILLEPADLDSGNTVPRPCGNYVLVAKSLMRGDADAGFFLAEAWDRFSPLIRNSLRSLVRSQIYDVKHLLLLGPNLAPRRGELVEALLALSADAKGRTLLDALGFTGWEAVEPEDVEFMIDLIDTLV